MAEGSLVGDILTGYALLDVLPTKLTHLAGAGLHVPLGQHFGIGGSSQGKRALVTALRGDPGLAMYGRSGRARQLVEASRGITARLPGIGRVLNPAGRRAFLDVKAARIATSKAMLARGGAALTPGWGGLKSWGWKSLGAGAQAAGLEGTAGTLQFTAARAGAAFNAAMWPYFITHMTLGAAYGIGKGIGGAISNVGQTYLSGRPEYSVPFYDSEQAYTMRQAGLQAIHGSQMGRGQWFGREAELMHG